MNGVSERTVTQGTSPPSMRRAPKTAADPSGRETSGLWDRTEATRSRMSRVSLRALVIERVQYAPPPSDSRDVLPDTLLLGGPR